MVTLVTRDAVGTVKSAIVKKAESDVDSKGDCRTGLAAVRLSAVAAGWAVHVLAISAPTSTNTGKAELFIGAASAPTSKSTANVVTLDTSAGAGPTAALAWRGLSGTVDHQAGYIGTAVEASDINLVRRISWTLTKAQ